ncbi:VOC family protein [Streptomyces sp. NPDC053429]|uniref:VOC family protein n=1 Tax=Streptomyces sp. NPDC053429 TaxID=3365702 RepID=UPI0037CD5C52
MIRSYRSPLLFLDIDGPLIPFGGAGYPAYPAPADTGANPLLERLDPALGPRLASLPCELVWATTWMADANPLVGRRLGLPELPVLDLPEPSGPEPEGLHWKTRSVVAGADRRPFVWVDDEITSDDRAWVAAHHPGRALLHRVDPRTGLTGEDFGMLGGWLRRVEQGRGAAVVSGGCHARRRQQSPAQGRGTAMLSTDYRDGSPNWLDLGTPDTDGAAGFYRGLFGWDYEPGGQEVGGYGMFRLGGKTVAGGMTVTPEQGPSAWTVYFRTPDLDATAAAVRESGGAVAFEPMDVLDLGRMAVFTDPAGVAFAAWQPGRHKGLDEVTAVGTLCWTELYTPDVAAAAAFYRAVFGWEVAEMPFEGGTYTMVKPAGAPDEEAFGGLVPIAADPVEDTERPYWTPYFEVADCDATAARVEESGGKVRLTPVSMDGVGRFAKAADPFGARFAVITSAPAPGA